MYVQLQRDHKEVKKKNIHRYQRIWRIHTTRLSWSINIPHRENLHAVRKIFMVNQAHRENLRQSSPQEFHGQSIVSDV